MKTSIFGVRAAVGQIENRRPSVGLQENLFDKNKGCTYTNLARGHTARRELFFFSITFPIRRSSRKKSTSRGTCPPPMFLTTSGRRFASRATSLAVRPNCLWARIERLLAS